LASDAPLLAFDTSAAHCAAALLLGDRIVTRAENMARGQAERLMPLLDELLRTEGVRFSDLGRIGVGTGPGNFTGIRISVAAARGLALGLCVPAIGVSCLAALRAASSSGCAAIAAPRGMAYVQMGEGAPVLEPLADVPPDAALLDCPENLVAAIARLAARAAADDPAPAPFYLKSADAAPSRDLPPRLLDDA
jgi:tRNA threonylcarbamoyl adenosine modification protein YeaZ